MDGRVRAFYESKQDIRQLLIRHRSEMAMRASLLPMEIYAVVRELFKATDKAIEELDRMKGEE